MSSFLWLCFDGGGNIPPSLGIARALRAAGHEVSFVGRAEMVPRVEPARFAASELASATVDADRYAWHPRGALFSYLTSPEVEHELAEIVATERPDVVVADAMFGSALAVARATDRPTAVMVHTFLHRPLDDWRVMMATQSEVRQQCGFPPLPPVEELWGGQDLVHVNTLAEFDGEPRVSWGNVRHGAPVLEPVPSSSDDPAPASDEPLVLVSFSTEPVQQSVGKLQRTLDGTADLPVRVVATTGDALDPARLRSAGNAHVARRAAHGPLMERAAAVVTHGGHGTVMRAAGNGVPIVLLVGKAADQEAPAALDQPFVGAFVEDSGAGLVLPADAPADDVREAVSEVLTDGTYRARARRLAARLREHDGAAEAAARLTDLAA